MVRTFDGLVCGFLTVYLPRTRGYSANTISAYRDSFILYLHYMENIHGILPDAISFSDFTPENIAGFLGWLENARKCSVSTCNSRLAVLKSFFRYVQSQAPELIVTARPVLEIKAKKTVQPEIAYISVPAIGLLMQKAMESGGIRDAAMLSLLYDTGARVQEIVDATASDVHIEKPCTIKLRGKGNKTRVVPITPQVADILQKYLSTLRGIDGNMRIFRNWKNEPIGRAGIAHILQKHAGVVHLMHPDIMPPKVTPHMLRHSKATHLLENGVNLIYIRDLLGHCSVITTEVYAKANPEMKRKAIESSSARIIDGSYYDSEAKRSLLDWLRESI